MFEIEYCFDIKDKSDVSNIKISIKQFKILIKVLEKNFQKNFPSAWL